MKSCRETFSCRFRGGVTVGVSIDIEAIQGGKNIEQVLEFQWSGTPSRKIIPDYVRWMHTVMSDVAKRVSKRILYAYPPDRGLKPIIYIYEPDGTFKQSNGT